MRVVRYHNLSRLSPAPPHGSFARWGGVSRGPLAELNVGWTVGDAPELVEENRGRIKAALGLAGLVSSRQVHGDRVAIIREQPAGDLELDGYDALVCNRPGVGLLIAQADCQAVLLYDPQQQVVANIHAGWRGSVANIIAATVRVMVQEFGCRPRRLLAAISPSLGPCCAEFVNYRHELPVAFLAYQVGENNFDFPAISSGQLQAVGVPAEQIERAGICTRCSDDFFSHRRDPGGGRNCSVIAVPVAGAADRKFGA